MKEVSQLVRLFGGKLRDEKEFQVKINLKVKLSIDEYDRVHGLWVKHLLHFKEELEEQVRQGKINTSTYDLLSRSFEFDKYLDQGVRSDEGLAAVFAAATKPKHGQPRSESRTPSLTASSSTSTSVSVASHADFPRAAPTVSSPSASPAEATDSSSIPMQSPDVPSTSTDIPPPPLPAKPSLPASPAPLPSILEEVSEMTKPASEPSSTNTTAASPISPPIPPPPPPLPMRNSSVRASPTPSPATPSPATPSLNLPRISIRASPVNSDQRRVHSLKSEEERATGIAVLRQRMLAQLREKKGTQ